MYMIDKVNIIIVFLFVCLSLYMYLLTKVLVEACEMALMCTCSTRAYIVFGVVYVCILVATCIWLLAHRQLCLWV